MDKSTKIALSLGTAGVASAVGLAMTDYRSNTVALVFAAIAVGGYLYAGYHTIWNGRLSPRTWKYLWHGVVAIGLLYSIFQISVLREDVAAYSAPRKVTAYQAKKLAEYLKDKPKFTVTVSSYAEDREGREYAAQIFNAVMAAGWSAIMAPWSPPKPPEPDAQPGAATKPPAPEPANDGLCLSAVGSDAPEQDNRAAFETLLAAFAEAGISINCMGGDAATFRKLYLLVGRRPIAIYDKQPLLWRLGETFQQWGSR